METLLLTCPTVTGRNFTLYQSEPLSGNWIPSPGQPILPGNGGNLLFTIPAPFIGVPKRFHRVQVGP